MRLTSEQLGRLLFKAAHEPRRNQKRFLKDCGGDGSAAELDETLARARRSPAARKECDRLERTHELTTRSIEQGVDGRVAEMLADVRLHMADQELTQQDIANACGWPQPLVSDYLNGKKEPGIANLAKLAAAVGCVWRLKSDPSQPAAGLF